MVASVEKTGWFTRHRSWEDYCSAGLGVLVVLSPILAAQDVGTAIAVSTGLTGILIAMVALMELLEFQRWEEVVELACGAWLAAAPFVLAYGGALRLSHVLLGAAVMALALLELWQDRDRPRGDQAGARRG